MLMEIYPENMDKQYEILDNAFHKWKNKKDQVEDI